MLARMICMAPRLEYHPTLAYLAQLAQYSSSFRRYDPSKVDPRLTKYDTLLIRHAFSINVVTRIRRVGSQYMEAGCSFRAYKSKYACVTVRLNHQKGPTHGI